MILYNAISSFTDSNNTNKENYFKRKSGNVNSLSHELQVKNSNNEKKAKEQNEKTSNDKKNKMIRPNIINKTKNHDKKIHINKFQKK